MKVKVMMATALAALVMLSGCGSTPAASSEVETYSSAMQLVTLTDDEMLTSIQEAAKELQKKSTKPMRRRRSMSRSIRTANASCMRPDAMRTATLLRGRNCAKPILSRICSRFSMTMIGLTATAMSTSIPLADAVVRRLIP